MFGIGTSEFLVIMLVALLVLGPEHLPRIMRTVNKVMSDFRRISTDFQRTINLETSQDAWMQQQAATTKKKKKKKAAPKAPEIKTPPHDVAAEETAALSGMTEEKIAASAATEDKTAALSGMTEEKIAASAATEDKTTAPFDEAEEKTSALPDMAAEKTPPTGMAEEKKTDPPAPQAVAFAKSGTAYGEIAAEVAARSVDAGAQAAPGHELPTRGSRA